MMGKTTRATTTGAVAMVMVLSNAIVLKYGYILHPKWYWMLLITLPLAIYSLIDLYRNKS